MALHLLPLAKLLPDAITPMLKRVRKVFWRWVARRVVRALAHDAVDARIDLYGMIDFRVGAMLQELRIERRTVPGEHRDTP